MGERVRLLQRATAHHRLLSIAVSLDTSWKSPLMTGPARRLLSLLGRLPDGIASDQLVVLLPAEGPAGANALRRRGLVVEDPGRSRALPPVRHHVADAPPPDDEDWQRATAHYGRLAETLSVHAGHEGGSTALAALAKDSANITTALTDVLTGLRPSTANTPAWRVLEAAYFSGADGASLADALRDAAERGDDQRALAETRFRLGRIAFARSDHDAARRAYEQAQALSEQIDIALARSDHDAARRAYEQAPALCEQVRRRARPGQLHHGPRRHRAHAV